MVYYVTTSDGQKKTIKAEKMSRVDDYVLFWSKDSDGLKENVIALVREPILIRAESAIPTGNPA